MNWKLKKFNELTVEEMYEILRIRADVFVVEQKCPYQDCDDKDKKAVHLFLEDGGRIAAYLRILQKGVSYKEISIGRVLVDRQYRRKGLAREMLLKAIKYVEETLNEHEIRISAQAYLIEFYKSVGFVQVSKQYLEDGIPHVEMFYKKN